MKLIEQLGKKLWETVYPDRRKWEAIGTEAQEEWMRFITTYERIRLDEPEASLLGFCEEGQPPDMALMVSGSALSENTVEELRKAFERSPGVIRVLEASQQDALLAIKALLTTAYTGDNLPRDIMAIVDAATGKDSEPFDRIAHAAVKLPKGSYLLRKKFDGEEDAWDMTAIGRNAGEEDTEALGMTLMDCVQALTTTRLS